MSYIYLATDDEHIPICVAESIQKLEQLLFEYYGLPNKKDVEYLGFTKVDDCGYPNTYEGNYKFKIKYEFLSDEIVERVSRYCLIVNELR